MKATNKYKHCNHHHELTSEHSVVDFGDGEFVANNQAIPLLKALADIGVRTRTHHIDDSGHGFFSFIIDPHVDIEIRQVHEKDANRSKYNGLTEVLVRWCKGDPQPLE